MKTQMQSLEREIDKMKQNKVSISKKLKEESEKHRKWQNERAKELLQQRKANLRKDQEILQLKREYKKKEILAQRKQEEVQVMQRRQKEQMARQANAQNMRNKQKGIDPLQIQSWILGNTDKMVRQQELQEQVQEHQQKANEIEERISEENKVLSATQLRLQRIKAKLDDDELSEDVRIPLEDEQEELQRSHKMIREEVENLEETFDFVNQKISKAQREMLQLDANNVEQLDFSGLNNIEGARMCLSAFFGILLDANVHKRKLEREQEKAQKQTVLREKQVTDLKK